MDFITDVRQPPCVRNHEGVERHAGIEIEFAAVSARQGARIVADLFGFPMFAFNIWIGGGRAVRWHAGRSSDLDDVEGLVIGGGDDISPDIYAYALT